MILYIGILNVWRQVSGKIASGVTVRGDGGVAGKERLGLILGEDWWLNAPSEGCRRRKPTQFLSAPKVKCMYQTPLWSLHIAVSQLEIFSIGVRWTNNDLQKIRSVVVYDGKKTQAISPWGGHIGDLHSSITLNYLLWPLCIKRKLQQVTTCNNDL